MIIMTQVVQLLVLLGIAAGATPRPRPRILPNSTIVTGDSGVPLRGPAWSKCFLRGGNLRNISEPDLRALMAFENTPFNAIHVYHDPPGCPTGGIGLEEVDNIVEWAAKYGVYVVLVASGDSWSNQWSRW